MVFISCFSGSMHSTVSALLGMQYLVPVSRALTGKQQAVVQGRLCTSEPLERALERPTHHVLKHRLGLF